jgi:hypothetical protein
MTRKTLLVITDAQKATSKFYEPPYSLSPDKVRVTGPASLNYIGFTNISAIVIDSPGLYKDLKKISLGIRDSVEAEALWGVFAGETNIPVHILVDQKASPSREMRELGIDYILATELRELANESGGYDTGGNYEDESSTDNSRLLTADDVRQMHQNGARSIPSDSRLTSWAAEVADSLGMSVTQQQTRYLINLASFSKKDLLDKKTEIHELAIKLPELLFVINPLLIASFADIFPSLRSKIVSPTIHWAKSGAFTGEVSAAMLADQRCRGAIVPAKQPYCQQENLNQIIAQAKKHDLELFSTFTLASGTGCDIIANGSAQSGSLTPLYRAEMLNSADRPDSGAIIADWNHYMGLPFRKGNY